MDSSTRTLAGPRAMVGEACSRKGTFRPDRGFVFLSGLRLASSKFRKFGRISDLAYFFAEICLILPDLAKKRCRTQNMHEKSGIKQS